MGRPAIIDGQVTIHVSIVFDRLNMIKQARRCNHSWACYEFDTNEPVLFFFFLFFFPIALMRIHELAIGTPQKKKRRTLVKYSSFSALLGLNYLLFLAGALLLCLLFPFFR